MPRKPRFLVNGIPYHITHRGINKMPIFGNNYDKFTYLETLKDAKEKYPCKIFSYCLMNNHVHILVESDKAENISNLIHYTAGIYALYFNRLYKRTGSLWEGRFKSSLVNSENYFISCLHYIESNPVRAGLTNSPEEYPWSSYRSRAFGKKSLSKTDPWYDSLGQTPLERQLAYRKIFEIDEGDNFKLIREATNKNGILGIDYYQNQPKIWKT